jgi:hypothetical protein
MGDLVLSNQKVIFYLIKLICMTKTTKAKKTAPRTTSNTSYQAVSKNIYFDGTSYRVRVSVNGTKHSKNFSSKRNAIQYRNQLLNG